MVIFHVEGTNRVTRRYIQYHVCVMCSLHLPPNRLSNKPVVSKQGGGGGGEMASPSPPISFGETWAFELPGRCNVYLSESRPLPRLRRDFGGSCTAAEAAEGRLIRFATENHSVVVVKDQISGEYSLSSSRLPSTTNGKSKKREERTKRTPKQRIKQKETTGCFCLAHSHLVSSGSGCDDSISLEAYALMSSPAASHSDNNTLATGNHSGLDDLKSVGNNTLSGGSSKCNPNKDAAYSLLVKCRQHTRERRGESNQAKPPRASGKSYREAISLQHRPLCVHACETTITTPSGDERGVAIFASSVKDGKLHLYLANADSVQARVHRDSATSSGIPCFQEVDLGLGINMDQGPDCSFRTASPITSLEACRSPNNTTTYVAISCYDGTIRVVALLFSKNPNEAEVINVEIRSNSTFLVDGPAVTLRFGCKDDDSLILVAGSLYGYACLFYQARSRKGEEQEFGGPLMIVDDLYDPQNNSEDSITSAHVARGSDGRLIIIVGTHRGRVLIFQQLQVVDKATQLLDKAARELAELQNQREQDRGEKSELECVVIEKKSRVNELNETFSRLRTKLDLMQATPPTLAADEREDAPVRDRHESQLHGEEILMNGCSGESESVINRRDSEPGTEPFPSEDPQTQLGSPTVQIDEIETERAQNQNLEENEPDDEPKGLEPESGAPHATDQRAVLHAELDDVTQELNEITENLSQCTAAISELDVQAVEREKGIQRLDSFPSRLKEVYDLERGTHRYEILREAEVPYPVQGITSSVTENGSLELFVTTTLTLHVFRER